MGLREVRDTEDHISAEAVEQSATRIVPQGSVLIVVRSGILVHRFPVAITRRAVALNQDLKAMVPRDFVAPDYLAYSLEWLSDAVLAQCVKRGATVHSVDIGKLKALEIPLPPLSEQRRIVEILDQANSLRCLRAEADSKTERILPALFTKMFGDPAANPMGWPVGPLRKILSRVERRNPRDRPHDEFVYVDIAGLDGTTGRISTTKTLLGQDAPSRARQVIRARDVLVSTVRPYLRATAMVPEELDGQICSTGFCVLRCARRLGHGYLYALTRMTWFTEQLNSRARGASYPAVTDSDIWNLPACLPRDAARLTRADAVVDRILQLGDMRRSGASRIERLFEVLLAGAFSGHLTAYWRQANMQELLQEMEEQAKALRAAMV
jgi:type I restriction enzyme S subunit